MARWKNRPEGSTWGDFGPDDQLGRLNFITNEKRLAGVREVKEGKVFMLGLPLDMPGDPGNPGGRCCPVLYPLKIGGGQNAYNLKFNTFMPGSPDILCDDGASIALQYSSQWDGFPHWGQMFDADGDGEPEPLYYNGYKAGVDVLDPESAGGPKALKLGIENFSKTGMQGRGVLVNLFVEYGHKQVAVGYDGLMRAMEKQGVRPEKGDFFLVYTGMDQLVMAGEGRQNRDHLLTKSVGLDGQDKKLLQWITDSNISAICSDNVAVETYGPGATQAPHGASMLGLHAHCLFKLGVPLGEFWYLQELAEYLLAAKRTAFLLTAPPLRLPGAVGSPATPVATV
jgi:kynurenine formamidase